jgi:hypothetical protein
MKNLEMAKDYLFRAKRCLEEANFAFKAKDYPGSVRRSQESLELTAKSLLRYLGVEYPKEHDVSDALEVIKDKLPSSIKQRLKEFKRLLTELAEVRGPAFYGYEREGIPPSKAFGKAYAWEKLKGVGELALLCIDFIGE